MLLKKPEKRHANPFAEFRVARSLWEHHTAAHRAGLGRQVGAGTPAEDLREAEPWKRLPRETPGGGGRVELSQGDEAERELGVNLSPGKRDGWSSQIPGLEGA